MRESGSQTWVTSAPGTRWMLRMCSCPIMPQPTMAYLTRSMPYSALPRQSRPFIPVCSAVQRKGRRRRLLWSGVCKFPGTAIFNCKPRKNATLRRGTRVGARGGKGKTMTSFIPDGTNARQFRRALGQFATGVCVITTRAGDEDLGITANSFSSVSLDPPLVLWSPAKASFRFQAFSEAAHYAIHVLREDQHDLAMRFSRSGRDFDGLALERTAEGVPELRDCLARFTCEKIAGHDAGDHLIVVGRVKKAMMGAGKPLLFACGQYGTFSETDAS